MNIRETRLGIGSALCAVFVAGMVAASSATATIVWDLNPTLANQPVGSPTRTYNSQGYSITAYGFDNNNGTGSPRELFYKNVGPIGGASEFGLGITGTFNNELQSANGSPLQFIQFDINALLAGGLMHGQISVGSIQAGEEFALFGSNVLGQLGTQLGGTYGSAFDNQFIDLPNYGTYRYYSVGAIVDDVLPVALRADLPPIPEVNAMLPVAGLMVLVIAFHARRRRAARSA